jgi:hypothetical protein
LAIPDALQFVHGRLPEEQFKTFSASTDGRIVKQEQEIPYTWESSRSYDWFSWYRQP